MNSLSIPDQERSIEVDPIEEMRMRTWARRHYTPAEDRGDDLHPIVLDEMVRKDQEGSYPKTPK